MERYSSLRLFYLKDELRFRELYETIIGCAKLGHKQKILQVYPDDNILYLIDQLKFYFPETRIENGNTFILVNWDIRQDGHLS